jgi:hypothetical protein
VITRRFDESDDEWRDRLDRAALRDQVRVRRDAHRVALSELRKYAWRAKFVTIALLTGVISALGIAGVITLERWFDGFAPYLGLLIPLVVFGLAGGLMFTDEYERRADRRDVVVTTGYAYRESYAEYLHAGGGSDVTDGFLAVPGSDGRS